MPYNYTWSNGATTDSLGGLQPGLYIVKVTDNSSCSVIDTFQIAQSVVLTNISGSEVDCHNNPGGASITIKEGIAPYIYSWSNGATTSAISVSDMGTYHVQV